MKKIEFSTLTTTTHNNMQTTPIQTDLDIRPTTTSIFHRLGRRPPSPENRSITERLYYISEKRHRRN
jgi:hypothetical protein